jgi:hypothetical protein
VTKTNCGGVDITQQESVVVVPCICMEGHDMDTPEGRAARKSFMGRIKKQFDCECASGCLDALVHKMQAAKPGQKSTPSTTSKNTTEDTPSRGHLPPGGSPGR